METRGMGTQAMIAIIAIAVVAAAAAYYGFKPEGEKMMHEGEAMMEEGEKMMKDGEAMIEEGDAMKKEGEAMMEKDSEAMMESSYQGALLGGTTDIPLLDFNQADYEKALAEGKFIALFFYANWCPTCRAEFPKMVEAFNMLPALSSVQVKDVVGFRVNYNDNETDSYERGLASEFGVAYQHTKVFVKDGERILKSPESWSTMEKYITEIRNAL